MERYIEDRVVPKIDSLERRLREAEKKVVDLQAQFAKPPTIDFQITSTNAATAIDNAKKAYEAFGTRTNFNLKVVLTEVTDDDDS